MMGTIKSFDQARALAVARDVLKDSFPTGGPIWRRRIRYTWQTPLRRAFVVELLPSLELRMTDAKTGELICIGPAK